METKIKPIKVEFDSNGYKDLISKIENLEESLNTKKAETKKLSSTINHVGEALTESFRFHEGQVLDITRPFKFIVAKNSLPSHSPHDNKVLLLIEYLD